MRPDDDLTGTGTASASPLAERLEALAHRLEHVLPGQPPIRDFVHHNTLHGYQHLPFHDALRKARAELGIRAYPTPAAFRAELARGRITLADIDAVIGEQPGKDEVIAAARSRQLRRSDLFRLALRHDLSPRALATLARKSGDSDPVDNFQRNFQKSWPDAAGTLAHDPFIDGWHDDTAWASLAATVGPCQTLRGLLAELTGEDALEPVRPLLLRLLGNFLDLGLADWHSPQRKRGLYASVRALPADDPVGAAQLLPDARREIAALPADPVEAIAQELACTGVEESLWMDYLERLALELPGWSGMVLWRHLRPDYRDAPALPTSLPDYLAIRLVLERLATQDIIRRHWQTPAAVPALATIATRLLAHPGELRVRLAALHPDTPEALAGVLAQEVELACLAEKRVDPSLATAVADAAPVVREKSSAARRWPVGALLHYAGWTNEEAATLDSETCARLSAELAAFDDDAACRIWLEAYERHYREPVLGALAANHGRFRGHPERPAAQLAFCMDEREEGMRRHLEEVAPEVETFGVAAHFGVFQHWLGLDDSKTTPLAPVIPEVVRPAHEVREVVRDETALPLHRYRHALRRDNHLRLHALTRHGGLRATLLAAFSGPLALLALLGRTLFPGAFGRTAEKARQGFEATPTTRIAFTAPDDARLATPEEPRLGFTADEQAERIGNFLRGMGLVTNFAPLVVIAGHGSSSMNNPHAAAYDCGACAGRHSGPNARLFAAMANHPPVRERLAATGILIPDDTWFLGAEHNTCDDGMTWYDTGDLPESLRPAFARLERQLAAAVPQHAKERCRRLASAPLDIPPDAALRHVQDRRHDLGQPRPELGHVTNACAVVGRRRMTRGLFLDRRSFMISYDPSIDADGRILERLLVANGPVGAGISLEYYFSTVNNDRFGCGTKIVHNVTGLFGVMEGASSDLRTGLPKQMIEIHEPMRLLVVVEQKIDVVTAIYERQPALQELIGKGWILLAAKDPGSPAIHRFVPGKGWVAWQPAATGHDAPATVERSIDWFAGHRDSLPPALLTRPLATRSGVAA